MFYCTVLNLTQKIKRGAANVERVAAISKYDLSMTTIYYAGIVWLYCIVLYCDLVQSTRKIKRRAFKHAASCLILY